MTRKTLKKKIYDCIDHIEDNKVIEAVYTILSTHTSQNDSELSTAQKKELDKRLTEHKAGKLKYYTIEEVKKAVSKAIKK